MKKAVPVLLVKLHAPPVDGKANTELLRFLADSTRLPKGQITLLRGTSSRQKVGGTCQLRRWSGCRSSFVFEIHARKGW
jgi:uncharacterized protein YggU (UPF0235/DUF167 family)